MNTKPTSEKIIEAAMLMEEAAKRLRHEADQLNRTGNFTIAGDCIYIITNMFNSMRLDLFVSRPVREYQRKIARSNHNPIL